MVTKAMLDGKGMSSIRLSTMACNAATSEEVADVKKVLGMCKEPVEKRKYSTKTDPKATLAEPCVVTPVG